MGFTMEQVGLLVPLTGLREFFLEGVRSPALLHTILVQLPRTKLRRLRLTLDFPSGESNYISDGAVVPIPLAEFCTAALRHLIVVGFHGSFPRLNEARLVSAEFWGCAINDQLLRDITTHRRRLKRLVLEGDRSSQYSFESLSGPLPNLIELYVMSQTAFGDAALEVVSNCRLAKLHASGTAVTNAGLITNRHLLGGLKVLLLFGTDVGDSGLQCILTWCDRLTHLDLRASRVTNAGVPLVGSHQYLESASFSNSERITPTRITPLCLVPLLDVCMVARRQPQNDLPVLQPHDALPVLHPQDELAELTLLLGFRPTAERVTQVLEYRVRLRPKPKDS